MQRFPFPLIFSVLDFFCADTTSFRLYWNSIKIGCLTFPGYVEFWHQNNAELEQDEALIAMAFKFFDKNADGRVDKAEFFESLQKIGDPLTSDEIESFFKHVRSEEIVSISHYM